MAYLQTEQPHRGPFRLGWQRGRPIVSRSALQWLFIAMIGAVLGLYTLGISALPLNIGSLLILALLLLCMAVVVGNVRRLLLGLIRLDIPLQLDVHLSYRYDLAALNAIGGVSISVTTIALIILYAIWFGES